MEPQAALIGADGGVEFHPIAPVDLHLSAVVHPGYPELNGTFRLYQPLDDPAPLQLGTARYYRLQRLQYLQNGLEKLRLMGALFFQRLIDAFQVRAVQCHMDQTPLLGTGPVFRPAKF